MEMLGKEMKENIRKRKFKIGCKQAHKTSRVSKPELGLDGKTTLELEMQLLKIQQASNKMREEMGYMDTPVPDA